MNHTSTPSPAGPDQLLTTKLSIPPPRPGLVARSRLIAQLDVGTRRKLTLIAAPAGSGKTTLLSAWLYGSGGCDPAVGERAAPCALPHVAWVSLDAADNDPARFWSHVLTALDQLHAGVGAGAMALLQPPHPAPIEAVLTTLLNALAATREQIFLLSGDVVGAGRILTEAMTLSQAAGNIFITLFVLRQLGEQQAIQGQLRFAAGVYQQALDLADARQILTLPVVGTAYVGMGELLYEWNDLDGATRRLMQGIEHGQRGGMPEILLSGYMNLAQVKQARVDAPGATQMCRQALQIARQTNAPRIIAWMAALQARLWLAQGQIAAAVHWAQTSGFTPEDTPNYLLEIDYITLARVLIAQGDTARALSFLERLLQAAETAERMRSVIEILTLQAVAHQMCGNPAVAWATLERALILAEPEGFVRMFIDLGEPIERLLRQWAETRNQEAADLPHPIAPYIYRLITVFAQVENATAATRKEPRSEQNPGRLPGFRTALSRCEREVLHLIASGKSNQEIARELVVAMSTVKKHINNIYMKLEVHSRTQALARARALHLL